MSGIIVKKLKEFETYAGKEFGYSEYIQITQDQINRFAEATLDFQWIHTDPERAAVESQFGTTIAHGYLTVSMLPHLWEQIVKFENIKMMVNYGIENLKFSQAVRVNDRIRLYAKNETIQNLRGTIKSRMKAVMQIEGSDKPAFEAIVVFLYHFE